MDDSFADGEPFVLRLPQSLRQLNSLPSKGLQMRLELIAFPPFRQQVVTPPLELHALSRLGLSTPMLLD